MAFTQDDQRRLNIMRNKLATCAELLGEDFPYTMRRIVFIGGQSSGKTALMNRLTGFRFPTGVDMKTRCPLRLDMFTSNDEEYVLSYQLNKQTVRKQLASKDDIPDAVEQATTAVCEGSPQQVSKSVLHLTARASHLPNLSLTDFPGLQGSALAGFPENTHKKIEEMVKEGIAGSSLPALTPSNILLVSNTFCTAECRKPAYVISHVKCWYLYKHYRYTTKLVMNVCKLYVQHC